MKIDFDPDKDRLNQEKHGYALSDGALVFEDIDVQVIATFRKVDGEKRYKAIGIIRGDLVTAVFVRRDSVYRFISVRRSNGKERRDYHSG